MLAVPGGLADVERYLIRARTSEGRERAKARGVKLGRKPKLPEHQKREAIRSATPTARDRPPLPRQPQLQFRGWRCSLQKIYARIAHLIDKCGRSPCPIIKPTINQTTLLQ
jgi:DNA invertase Pin-like site-specific DNA recombinase